MAIGVMAPFVRKKTTNARVVIVRANGYYGFEV